MWLMTTAGFLSAVARYNDPDHLTVRARDKRSATALVDQLNELNTNGYFDLVESYTHENVVRGTEKQDYRWRVVVHRADFAAYVAYEVMTYVVYHNFKDAATKVRGEVYHDSLMDVWWNMRDLTKEEDGVLTGKQAKFKAVESAWLLRETPEGVAEDPDYLDDWGDELDEDLQLEQALAQNEALGVELNSMTDEEFAAWSDLTPEAFAVWLKNRC